MDHRPIIVISTILCILFDIVHFISGIGISATIGSNLSVSKGDEYYGTFIGVIFITIVSGISIFIGIYSVHKNIKNGLEINTKRAYDIYNFIFGIIIVILSSQLVDNYKSYQYLVGMYYFTVIMYVVKMIFCGVVLFSSQRTVQIL